MKNRSAIVLLSALAAAPFALASDPFVFTYAGLGTSPLGLELKKLSGNWSPRYSPVKVKNFLVAFRSGYPVGTDAREILEDAGLECAVPPAQQCTYTGVYTYELRRGNGKVVRSGNRMEVTVNFEQEPWDVKGASQFIYGGPPNWGQY